jgi:hypothetical protein
MTTTAKTKTRPMYLFESQGTALGSAGPIDTSSFQFAQFMSIHGGTSGSRTISVYANCGTTPGTSATTMPNLVFVGSRNSDQAGAGYPVWICGSLTDQAIVTTGTGLSPSFSLTYLMLE